MALYLGSGQKVKINLANNKYDLKLFSLTPILNGTRLLSSDNYILKDKNGRYLTAKEDK